MVITRLGNRYAKSILDLSVEMGVLEDVKADMEKIIATLESSRDLRILMKSPVVRPDKKVSILREIFKDELSVLTNNFIEIITRKGREDSLENIARGFINQYRVEKGISKAIVTTAVELDDAQRAQIKKQIAADIGQEIVIEEIVDPSIIGGITIRVGDKQYNGSIAYRLENLKRQFKDNLYVPEF